MFRFYPRKRVPSSESRNHIQSAPGSLADDGSLSALVLARVARATLTWRLGARVVGVAMVPVSRASSVAAVNSF